MTFANETEAINALWAAERKTRTSGKVGRRQLAAAIRGALELAARGLPRVTYAGGFEEAYRQEAEQRVLADQAPDSNDQLGQPRTCTACQHTSVPRPWTPGWTPDRELGWICPDCSRRRR